MTVLQKVQDSEPLVIGKRTTQGQTRTVEERIKELQSKTNRTQAETLELIQLQLDQLLELLHRIRQS